MRDAPSSTAIAVSSDGSVPSSSHATGIVVPAGYAPLHFPYGDGAPFLICERDLTTWASKDQLVRATQSNLHNVSIHVRNACSLLGDLCRGGIIQKLI